MLDVMSMWFSWFRQVDLHSVINSLLTSQVGYFLLIPIAGSVAIGLLHALRR